jgi:hypothetical protein
MRKYNLSKINMALLSVILFVSSFSSIVTFAQEEMISLEDQRLQKVFNHALNVANGGMLGFGIPTRNFFDLGGQRSIPPVTLGTENHHGTLNLGGIGYSFNSNMRAQIELMLKNLDGNGNNDDNKNYIGMGFGPRVTLAVNYLIGVQPTNGLPGEGTLEILSLQANAANYRRANLNEVIHPNAKWHQPGWAIGVFLLGQELLDYGTQNDQSVAQNPEPLEVNDFQIPLGPPAGYNVPIIPSVNAFFNFGPVFNYGMQQFVKGVVNFSSFKQSRISAAIGPQASLGFFMSLGLSVGVQGIGYIQAFLEGSLNIMTAYANAAITATLDAVKYPVALQAGIKMFSGKIDAAFRIATEFMVLFEARYNLVQWDSADESPFEPISKIIGILSRNGGPLWANCLGNSPHPHCAQYQSEDIVNDAGAAWIYGQQIPEPEPILPYCTCSNSPSACRTPPDHAEVDVT